MSVTLRMATAAQTLAFVSLDTPFVTDALIVQMERMNRITNVGRASQPRRALKLFPGELNLKRGNLKGAASTLNGGVGNLFLI